MKLLINFFPNDKNPNHIKSLDGLRGIAVLFVVLAHGSEISDRIDFPFDLKFLGRIGVFIFFVLSAFLLDMYISKTLKNGNDNFRYWLNYFLRRFLRIYPLFLISLIVYYFYYSYSIISIGIIKSSNDIIDHLIFREGNAMYWSIGVEFKYYFISPIIIYVSAKILRWKTNFINALLISIVVGSLFYFNSIPYENFRLANYIPFFIVGTFLGIKEIQNGKNIIMIT